MDQTQPIIQYTTVSDSVYLWVKNAIIQGEFKPGEHIAQERLTKTLGVSRTPVRDAIKRLEAEGLLITKPHCGAVVFQLSKERLTEIYDIRILMEQYCAARTCIRASDDDIRQLEEISLRMLDFSNNSKEFMRWTAVSHPGICELLRLQTTPLRFCRDSGINVIPSNPSTTLWRDASTILCPSMQRSSRD